MFSRLLLVVVVVHAVRFSNILRTRGIMLFKRRNKRNTLFVWQLQLAHPTCFWAFHIHKLSVRGFWTKMFDWCTSWQFIFTGTWKILLQKKKHCNRLFTSTKFAALSTSVSHVISICRIIAVFETTCTVAVLVIALFWKIGTNINKTGNTIKFGCQLYLDKIRKFCGIAVSSCSGKLDHSNVIS